MSPEQTSSSSPEPTFQSPSRNYREARESGVNRLSELMFGSLLASYVLGFIAFLVAAQPRAISQALPLGGPATVAAATSPTIEPGPSVSIPLQSDEPGYARLPRLIPYLFYVLISLSFTYLTVAMYVTYHVGILTMPHTPLERLAFDFALSLLPALCFGLAMVVPALYITLVTVTLTATLVRQAYEIRKLIEHLERQYPRASSTTTEVQGAAARAGEQVRRQRFSEIRRCLRGNAVLSGWQPVRGWVWAGHALLLGIAFAVDSGFLDKLLAGWNAGGVIRCAVAVVVTYIGHRTLKGRSAILADLVEGKAGALDTAARELDIRLAKALART